MLCGRLLDNVPASRCDPWVERNWVRTAPGRQDAAKESRPYASRLTQAGVPMTPTITGRISSTAA
jgi:hypothetical protein